MGATNTGECKTDSNNEGSSGMVRGAGSLIGEGEKWKVPSLCEENVLRSVGSHGSADRGVAGRGNGKQPSRKRCLSVKLDGQQVDPDKGPGPSSQLSSNIVNIKPGRLRYENKFCIGHDGGMATLTLHCEAKIDGTCKINSKALGKGDKQILEVGDRVCFGFKHKGGDNFMEYIIEEEEDTIAGYKLKVSGDNPPLQQSIRKRYKNGVDISSTSHLPAVSEKTTSERVRQMEIFMECPICAGFMVNPILTVPCGHSFCSSCWIGLGLTPHCPACRSIVTDTALNRGLNSFIELMVAAAGPERKSIVDNCCLDAEDVSHYKHRSAPPHCHPSYSHPYTVHFQTKKKTSENQNQDYISSRSTTFGEERQCTSLSSPQQGRRPSRKRVIIDLT